MTATNLTLLTRLTCVDHVSELIALPPHLQRSNPSLATAVFYFPTLESVQTAHAFETLIAQDDASTAIYTPLPTLFDIEQTKLQRYLSSSESKLAVTGRTSDWVTLSLLACEVHGKVVESGTGPWGTGMFLDELEKAMDGVTVETSFKTYHVAEGMRRAGGEKAPNYATRGVKHVRGIKHLQLRPTGAGTRSSQYNFVQRT